MPHSIDDFLDPLTPSLGAGDKKTERAGESVLADGIRFVSRIQFGNTTISPVRPARRR